MLGGLLGKNSLLVDLLKAVDQLLNQIIEAVPKLLRGLGGNNEILGLVIDLLVLVVEIVQAILAVVIKVLINVLCGKLNLQKVIDELRVTLIKLLGRLPPIVKELGLAEPFLSRLVFVIIEAVNGLVNQLLALIENVLGISVSLDKSEYTHDVLVNVGLARSCPRRRG